VIRRRSLRVWLLIRRSVRRIVVWNQLEPVAHLEVLRRSATHYDNAECINRLVTAEPDSGAELAAVVEGQRVLTAEDPKSAHDNDRDRFRFRARVSVGELGDCGRKARSVRNALDGFACSLVPAVELAKVSAAECVVHAAAPLRGDGEALPGEPLAKPVGHWAKR
jgi:hypothetical protein